MNPHKYRIILVSALLRYCSLVALIFLSVVVVIAVFAPVVSVERTFKGPAKLPLPDGGVLQAQQTDNRKGSEPWPTPGNRMCLQLSGKMPSLSMFSYRPGPSSIRPDRQWLARVSGLLAIVYGMLGCWLFMRLFAAFRTGEVYELDSIKRLKHTGWWFMGTVPNELIFNFSKYWWSDPISLNISLGLSPFVSGVFIFLIAFILEEAHLMQREVELTV